LDAYQFEVGLQPVRRIGGVGATIGGYFRNRALLPVVSDFLFDTKELMKELTELNATHDVFLVLIDSAFAFTMPPVSAGWIEIVDVETGRARTVSRRAYQRM